MIKKLLMFLICAHIAMMGAWAKKDDPVRQKAELIKEMPEFVWGEGRGNDPEEAYKAALFDMVRKISQTVWGEMKEKITEGVGEDGANVSSEMFTSVLESYTTPASLEGVQVLTLGNAPNFERFVYMPRENINRMQERRRRIVADLARSGIKARDNGKVDDALRHLYRSYVLLQSLPSPSDVKEKVDGEERMLGTWIHDTMRDIVNKVSFGVASVEDDPETGIKSVELTVKYDGKPATTCTFKYASADGLFSQPITARDGVALVELEPGVPLKPFNLYVEYQFRNENHVDSELKPILDSFNGSGLVNNEIALNYKKKELKADKKEAQVFQQLISVGAYEQVGDMKDAGISPYAEAMERILAAISAGRYADVKDLCTPDGWALFDKLMNYGRVRILGKATPDTYAFYPYRDEVMCRSVPMSFTFGKGSAKRTFTEDITFTFDADARLVSVGLGLGSIARNEIFSKQGAAWTDDRKMELVNFLENYRTAFALKQLDYIESIFDDNAVIIVGHVNKRLERVKGIDGFALASREDVITTQFTKAAYLERLRRGFNSQEYINLRFSDTDVERSGVGGETYAIQLKQDYVSTTYGDQGYLFLFVDFNDPDKPLIHVRTWQPERNPDITPNLPPDHPRAGIYSPASF